MMHPSLHQLLLVLVFNIVVAFAAGQQPYYSNHGLPSSPSASPSTLSNYHQPNLVPQQQQQYGNYHGQPQQQQQQQQPQPYHSTKDYHHQQQPTSQSSQHYSYAPAPSQGQSQIPYGYSTQAQQPVVPHYGSVQPTVSNIQQHTAQQQQPQQQYMVNQYGPPSPSVSPAPVPNAFVQPQVQALAQPQPQSLPQQQQPAFVVVNPQQQSSFSNRQLGSYSSNPSSYRTNPNMAMNAPPTTLSTSFSQAGPTPAAGGMIQSQFMSRRGPFDGMINRVKEWMPKGRGKPPYSAGTAEMNRLPKPPKYPLYDMPSLGMATPPPPPLMSPMAQMPTNLYSSFAHPPSSPHGSPRGGRPNSPQSHSSSLGSTLPRRNKNGGGGGVMAAFGGGSGKNKRRRNRPAPPPPPPAARSAKRGQRPRGKPSSTSTRNTYAPKPVSDGYDHPMASNVAPVNSPPLGRPLGFDEYMKRPSHSFTDDPWNFDPNAQSYNEGMNTHAMKYNYDPLGMNALDTSLQTHLDVNKMSYPGDIMNMESMKEPPKPLSSQLGGWDLPPSSYRTSSSSNQNSNNNYNSYSSHHRDSSGTGGFSRFDDHDGSSSSILFEDISPSSTTMKNSFNQYDPVTEASVIKSETLNPLDLISSTGGGIEFDLDSLNGGSSSNNNNNNHHHSHSSNNNGNYNDYKLSDHYSPSDDSMTDHSQVDQYSNDRDSYSGMSGNSYSSRDNTNSNNNRNRPYSQDYDQYTNSYNSYSKVDDYGTRSSRNANRAKMAHQRPSLQHRHNNNNNLNYSPSSSSSNSNINHSHRYSSKSPISSSSSSSSVSEGMGLFHDFIKDPNAGIGKQRARHSLYKALLS